MGTHHGQSHAGESSTDKRPKPSRPRAPAPDREAPLSSKTPAPASLDQRRLLRLQAAAGNQAVMRLLAVPVIQRGHQKDTGWRYKPPKKVKRSVAEIQGVAGSTPDGIYGIDTKTAVEKYQTRLKAKKLYDGSIDGKWGGKTEAAHVAYATGPSKKDYNCAGFAFKKFTFIGLTDTKAEYSKMTKMKDCTANTPAWWYKFWMWEVDVEVEHVPSGSKSATWHDFHTVGGQTNSKGEGPATVMSKNGPRPVEGPGAPLSWVPKSGPVIKADGTPHPDLRWNIKKVDLKCFCSKELPK